MNRTKIAANTHTATLLLAVVLGNLLNGDLADGPRALHRTAGMLAFLTGAATFLFIFRTKNPTKWLPFTALASSILTLVAGAAGKMLKESSSYDTTFAIMRISGILALIVSIVTIVVVYRDCKK